ncbi:MAG: hypothetical protein IJE23_06075 [Tyzzerella sp.]|nr:hypothetical protein [Tyzzerella sp.]
MTTNKKEDKVIKYPKNKQLNIGIIIFGIIFIYLLATIVMYLTAPRITVYEVRQGSILKDNAYTGLAIREETIVYADEPGYVNFYAENNSKVKVGTKIYTLSNQKLEFEKETVVETEQALSNEEKHSLFLKIQAYNNQFQENDFNSTYQLKNELETTLNRITSQSKTDQINQLISSGTYADLKVISSVKDGILVCSTDGMEELSIEEISREHFKKSNYKKTELNSNEKIAAGEPVYKIITNDKWNLLIEVSEATKAALQEKKTVKVNFKKDNQELKASITFLEQSEKPIVCLSFNNSMIRYVSDRYLDIELILEDESGLKIPKSAETSKEFYVVPKSYLTVGGNSSKEGVMRKQTNAKGETITEFLNVTVYYEEDEYVYLDPNAFKKGDVLIKPESMETYDLKETRSLKGVYCINKGYAVFKQIKILCESHEYYIIEEGNSFGLSNYDHIALDSSNIKENDVVF